MRELHEIKTSRRLQILEERDEGFAATFIHPYKPGQVFIIASWDMGWEHVSVSMKNRCPTWEEMCAIKDIFWCESECVVQYHPPKSEYINNHPYCLHLWKKTSGDFPQRERGQARLMVENENRLACFQVLETVTRKLILGGRYEGFARNKNKPQITDIR